MVDLGHHADVPMLQALDHPQLPERAAAVELVAGDVGDQLAELPRAARSGHGDPSHVVVEVEVGVFDPHRVVQPEGHLGQAAPERRQQVQALAQHLLDPLERVAALDGGRVEHRDLERVHVQRGGLHVEEPGVEARQPLHGRQSAKRRTFAFRGVLQPLGTVRIRRRSLP